MIIAIVLDAIVQYLIFDEVRITSLIIVAVMILIVPYSLARAITNKIATGKVIWLQREDHRKMSADLLGKG